MTTDTDEGIDPVLGLVAAIVQHNVDDLALTTNAIIASERRRAEHLARALIRVVKGIQDMPAMIRPVYLDDLVVDAYVAMDVAYRLLEELGPERDLAPGPA